jgi:AcrR family transcriptional regulator
LRDFLPETGMKKEKILDVAEVLFAEKGYEGTSIRDIAQMADVNIAMISYYFGSKEKLLGALITDRSEQGTFQLEELSRNNTIDHWTKVDTMVEFYVDRLFAHHHFNNIISRQIIQEKELQQQINNIKLKNLDIIRKIINGGIEQKVFRQVDVELTVTTVIATISQATMSRLFCAAVFHLDPAIGDKAYYDNIGPRVKNHLKSLLRAHLDIQNA